MIDLNLNQWGVFKTYLPLKIQIHKDLLPILFEQHPDQSRKSIRNELKKALYRHVQHHNYKTNMIAGAVRYNLDMQPSGIVSATELARAATAKVEMNREEKIAKIKTTGAALATKAAKTNAPAKAKTIKPVPKVGVPIISLKKKRKINEPLIKQDINNV